MSNFIVQFQFHKGSIQTFSDFRLWLFQRYFNSIKVQFKLKQNIKNLVAIEEFQFHKGSIQTRKFNAQQAQKSNFNSIKVQFKR